ncbi:MAG: HD domain-containing protein [Egibacteraceae bacterium]
MALGSYAGRQLCPASDVDLLLLHDGWRKDDLGALVQRLCYPLWDAGLTVGHAVRTVAESVRAAAERVDTATALTDRRLVAGDQGLLDDLASRMWRWLRRHGGRTLVALASADDRRHQRAGDRPGMLEPDLKEGAGGLRDLHSLRWAAACVLGEVGLDPLVGARYLGAADRHDLAAAGDTLLTVRCALHLVCGRRAGDVLRLDLQDEVAARLGWADGDELLRRSSLAMRTIDHVHGRAWPRLLADARGGRRRHKPPPEPLAPGVVLVDGLIEVEAGAARAADPALAWRAVAAAASCGVHLGRAAAGQLALELAASASEGVPWGHEARECLLATLRAGATGLAALADADHIGLLAAALPDWPRVRGHPQRNPFHRYDLDTHLARTVAEMVDLARGGIDPGHAELWDELADPDALLLGAWLHDVGKPWPGDHSETGAHLAAAWVAHMGFAARTAEQVTRYVRHHLVLPVAATRRDLDDAGELAALAGAVGDVETLDGLYLLSLADSRATGPSAHSPWSDGLIAELHARVRRVLRDGPEAGAPDPARTAADARAAGPADPALEMLLAAVPSRYLLGASAGQCRAHARLLLPLPGDAQLRVDWGPGATVDTEVVSVVCRDRLGLVADCAGVLAGHGVEVVDARAFTVDGLGGAHEMLALDWFVVRAPSSVDRDAVARDLVAAGAGEIDIGALVTGRERRRNARPPALAAPVDVVVRDDAVGGLRRVEVHGPDAPGVLYRLAGVLAAAGRDLVAARVATLGPEVRDVFFVRGDEPLPAELTAALRGAAAGAPRVGTRLK